MVLSIRLIVVSSTTLRNMGISIDLWRVSIGLFAFASCSSRLPVSNLHCGGHASLRLHMFLMSLLLLAGIEPNPGPVNKYDEIAAKLDAVLAEVKESRDQAIKNHNDIAAKFTAFVADVTTKLAASDASLRAFEGRLRRVELACDEISTRISQPPPSTTDSDGASSHRNPGAASSSASAATPAPDVDSLLREITERDLRKANVIFHGLTADAVTNDQAKADNLLNHVLRSGVNIKKCVRLGKDGGIRPRPLLVTLSSEAEARAALKVAPQLRKSTDEYIKASVYLNADLTKAQKEAEYLLRVERRQRSAAGEHDLVIRSGKVVAKHNRLE